MKAEIGRLKNSGWLDLPTISKEKIMKMAKRRESEIRMKKSVAPNIGWKVGEKK